LGSAQLRLPLITMSINQKIKLKNYYSKATICGKHLEIIFFNKIPKRKKRKVNTSKKITKEESILMSRKRTVRKITNLIYCNVWQWPKKNRQMFPPIFLTLTFKEEVTDLRITNRLYSEFIQNYNYKIFKEKVKRLQYIAVPEFQKNGRVHYHVLLFNLPYNIKNYDIAKTVWSHGYIWMKSLNKSNGYGISRYMSKYLVKSCDDPRLFKKRKYFPSAKILRPIELKGYFLGKNLLDAVIASRPLEKIKATKIDVDFIGLMYCYYCQLENNENLTDLFQALDQHTKETIESKMKTQLNNLTI
jgi:hypothetical protein